jgi:hypothetical protein
MEYLTTKRAAFPRLYFLSNEDFTSVLSEGEHCDALGDHFKVIYPGIELIKESDGKVTGLKAT